MTSQPAHTAQSPQSLARANAANAPRLEVLICTCRPDGIVRVAQMGLPRVGGVGYLVSWQEPGGAALPAELAGREDMRVVTLDGLGLSRNRNNALRHATGEILLMADDDVRYFADQLRAVIATFDQNPEVDYASFRYSGLDGKRYPREETDLSASLPRGFYQSSIEIAFRREKAASLYFNEDFGLGAPLFAAGEEELLLLRARSLGLRCRFFPLTISVHPEQSTGVAAPTEGSLRARGVVVALRYPLGWPLRFLAGAWKSAKTAAQRFTALRCQLQGAHYAITSRSLHRYIEGRQK